MKNFVQYLEEKSREEEIKSQKKKKYGQELILDVHDVPMEFFTKKNVRQLSEHLCDEIGMVRKYAPNYIWGEEKELHKTKKKYGGVKADGLSCIQFLYSSSILVHALDDIQKVFINIFSCEKFDAKKAEKFVLKTVGGKIVRADNIVRD